jgi:hypothetical protein
MYNVQCVLSSFLFLFLIFIMIDPCHVRIITNNVDDILRHACRNIIIKPAMLPMHVFTLPCSTSIIIYNYQPQSRIYFVLLVLITSFQIKDFIAIFSYIPYILNDFRTVRQFFVVSIVSIIIILTVKIKCKFTACSDTFENVMWMHFVVRIRHSSIIVCGSKCTMIQECLAFN